MFTVWCRNRGLTQSQPYLLFQQFARYGVEVVQIDNRFGILVARPQEVPAEDTMPTDLIPDRLRMRCEA